MSRVKISTKVTSLLADIVTPVGIYLRLRDRFRDTILLESTDSHVVQNSWSFIAINAIGGIEVIDTKTVEVKFPGHTATRHVLDSSRKITDVLNDFITKFEISPSAEKHAAFAQGLFGYNTYEAVRLFEQIPGAEFKEEKNALPLIRYRIYQYVVAINHYNDEMFVLENEIEGVEMEKADVVSLILRKDVPVYPFAVSGDEKSNMTDEQYMEMVRAGISHCFRGDVFQIVLSRRYEQCFRGDEFNVYRALRNINPSPYLFFFDYGDYKLMGSSPESQLIIQDGKAVIHPIAGTVPRTGVEELDRQATETLKGDAKENAEHVMLVDLARNDLSRGCDNVFVNHFKEVHYYSHVIHLVSEVTGTLKDSTKSFELFAKTFPAGTLSGAPKIKAMELISSYEPTARGYYAGAIGFMGFDGSCNQAIMIRTLLSRGNTLYYQAGAGIVAASKPENELQEVKNKLGALKKAILQAEKIK
ncbi:MAG: anthranilate synthase component I family protein [Niabella sp.]